MAKLIYFLLPELIATELDGGSEKVVLTIIRQLDRRLFHPKLILFRIVGDCSSVLSEVDCINLNVSNKLKAFSKLYRLLKKDQPEIFFSSMGPYNALIAPLVKRLSKTVTIARETNIPSVMYRLKISQGKWQYRIIGWFYKKYYRFYDAIVAQSLDMQQDLINNYNVSAEKITVINNPLDLADLKKKMVNSRKIFSQGNINILAVGRLVYQKGFDLAIKKMQSVQNERVRLYILGQGSEQKKLADMIVEYGLQEKVFLLGYDPNPYPYLQQADLYLLSSRTEGFPNALIEALATGLPAVVNNCPGGINEIIQTGFNGQIIDLTDKESNFDKAVMEVLALKKNKLLIQQDIEKRFGVQTIVDKYQNIFQQLIK